MHYIEVRELPSGDGAALLLQKISSTEVEQNLWPLMPTLVSDGILALYQEQKQAVDSGWGLVTKIVGDDKQAALASFCAAAGGTEDQYEHLYSNEPSISTMRIGNREAHQMAITPGRTLDERIYGDQSASPTLVLTTDEGTVEGFLVTIDNLIHLLRGSWDETTGALAVTEVVSDKPTIAGHLLQANVYPDATPNVQIALGRGLSGWTTRNLIPDAGAGATDDEPIAPFSIVHPVASTHPVTTHPISEDFAKHLLGYGSGGVYEPDVGDILPVSSIPDAISISNLPSLLVDEALDHLDRAEPPGELAHKNAAPPLNKGAFQNERVYIMISPKKEPLLRLTMRQVVQREGGRIVLSPRNAEVVIITESQSSLSSFKGRIVAADTLA